MNVEVFWNKPIKYADINATNIPSSIFYSCDNLEYVHIGSCVEKIETDAFNYCTVKNIKISDSVKYIGLNAFNTKNEVVINLPDTVEIIGFLPSSTGYSDLGETSHHNAVNNLKYEYNFDFFNNNSIVCVYDNLYDILNPLKILNDIRLFGGTNNDHKVNVADAVLLQKYLHSKGSLGYEADLTKDGLIDSFDMIPMRKMILNNK